MKLKSTALLVLLLTTSLSHGAAGIFESFVFTTTGSGNTFYDGLAATANPDFNGANLGTFNVGNTFFVGGQHKLFKDNGTDVTASSLSWRVFISAPSGAFTAVNMPFQTNLGGNDQQWGGNIQGANGSQVNSTNILAGLTPANYRLEIFTTINTNGVNAASVINQGNYTANFTVIPEPSGALLGLLGSALILRRRRA